MLALLLSLSVGAAALGGYGVRTLRKLHGQSPAPERTPEQPPPTPKPAPPSGDAYDLRMREFAEEERARQAAKPPTRPNPLGERERPLGSTGGNTGIVPPAPYATPMVRQPARPAAEEVPRKAPLPRDVEPAREPIPQEGDALLLDGDALFLLDT